MRLAAGRDGEVLNRPFVHIDFAGTDNRTLLGIQQNAPTDRYFP